MSPQWQFTGIFGISAFFFPVQPSGDAIVEPPMRSVKPMLELCVKAFKDGQHVALQAAALGYDGILQSVIGYLATRQK